MAEWLDPWSAVMFVVSLLTTFLLTLPAKAVSDESPASESAKVTAFMDAQHLLAMCKTNLSSLSSTSKLSDFYIMGLLDSDATRVSRGDPQLFCLPSGLSQRQIGDAVCDFAMSHPDLVRFSASSVIYAAMLTAYPCHPEGR